MINVLIIFLENITIWLCLHTIFSQKIKNVWHEILFPLVSVPLFSLGSLGILNKSIHILFVIFVFVWCKKKFKFGLLQTFTRMLIAFVLVGVVEASTMYIMYPIVKHVYDVETKCIMICVAMVILSWFIFIIALKKKYKIESVYIQKNIAIFASIIFLLWIYVKIEFELERRADVVYVFFFLVFGFTIYMTLNEQKIRHDLEKKNIMLEMNNVYGHAYKELLTNVRMRQHDYKNQLIAISGMKHTLNASKEVIQMNEEYIKLLNEESKFDVILLKCENPILAGYLYNICTKFFREGITIIPKIDFLGTEVNKKTKDQIEIIGILLENAKEDIKVTNAESNVIKLVVSDKNDNCIIEIKNKSTYKSFLDIEKMFDFGYSSKGEHRGIGLYSLKKIVNKYNGDIRVYNQNDNNENWICFYVKI